MQKLFKLITSGVIILSLVMQVLIAPVKSFAAIDATKYQTAQVSFTFDDGFESMYQNAAPILKTAGMKGTLYYITGIGDGTYQSGTTDDGKAGMTWAQVVDLQNNYGFEIGSHTVSHTLLSTVTPAQLVTELTQSKTTLQAHGINPVDTFAFPQGDYVTSTLVQTAKYYEASRGFQDIGLDTFPYNNIVINDESLDSSMTLAQAEALVDQAIANKQLLVFTGHGIQAKADANYAYIWTTANFQALVTYVKNKNVPVKTLDEAIAPRGTNVMTNASFEEPVTTPGVVAGWTNDNATQVTVDTNNNGSWPSPTNSVKTTGSATSNHLFSSLISPVQGATYLLQSFVNTTGLTAGEFGFYVDEYDTIGNWISGQWMGLVANNTVSLFSKLYQVTSDLVAQIRVQTYLTANSTGSVYADNINLYNLDATPSATPTITVTPTVTPTGTVTPTPSATPSATPTPVVTNLVTNPGFETTDQTFATAWTHDTANWTIDKNSTGNEATNSAKLTANSTANHLFTTLFSVPNTVSYTWNTFVKTTNLTGEFGFYIDEYNSAGVWISGQWKGMVNAAFNGVKTFVYTPTSNLVEQIRLQYYNTATSTGDVTVDSVSLTSNQPAATPTVTPTITVTPTVTVTPTPTGDPSATPSATPTPSGEPTPTATPSATPTPTVTVTPTVTPAPSVNLVVNPSFEQVTGSFASSWTQDTTNWTIDTSSAGNDGVNTAKLTMNAVGSHLFTALFPIDSTKKFVWSSYVSTLNLTGEFGFYIDEYDANDVWISGQWKTMISGPITNTISIPYTPTSTAVKKVRLQYYNTATSTGQVILDSISFTQN